MWLWENVEHDDRQKERFHEGDECSQDWVAGSESEFNHNPFQN